MTALHEFDEVAAVDRVTRMMAIPGKSCQEGKVVDFITKTLRRAGVPASAMTTDTAHKRSPAGGEVGNLIVKLRGTKRAPRRLLMGHIDTVPLCVGSDPIRRGHFIQSRDAATALGGDNRAGACVVLTTLLEILKQELPCPPLTAFFPVQEEIGLNGARFVSRGRLGSPALCFNWDGGDPAQAIIGATGAVNLEINITGIASHAGAHPEDGASAAMIAALALAELQKEGWHGAIQKGRRSGTSNVGVVTGGDATNVVMSQLRVTAEARSHDPAFRKAIVRAWERAFRDAVKSVCTEGGRKGSVEITVDPRYDSFLLAAKEPVVQAACEAVRANGLEPGTRIVNGGLDANWLTAHGFPTVTLGCGQQGIHTVAEQLHVPSFLHACRIGLTLASPFD